MKNKKWKKFDKLIQKCYLNMVGAEEDGSCWLQAFELLLEIIGEERQNNPDYAPELEMLEEITDYEHDIQGWLEDCLDEIDMRDDYETLLKMCNSLLDIFHWPEYTGSDIKVRKASILARIGHKEEAVKFCEKWLSDEPENIIAATAGVYSYIEIHEFKKAEQLVDQFIADKSHCNEENDFMFIAASTLYQITGKQKEKKVVDKAMEEYEKQLREYFDLSECDDGLDFDDDDMELLEDDLPFK